MERHESTDGEPLFTKVFTKGEAQEILKQMGVEVASEGVLPIYKKDWYTGLQKSNGYIHLYFFNSDGKEVAYYTPTMQTMRVHTTPRIWHQEIKDKLENPFLHSSH